MRFHPCVLFGGLLALCAATAAEASQTYSFSGETTASSPIFAIPKPGSPPTELFLPGDEPYSAFVFSVSTSGSYSFASTSTGYDNYTVLYAGSFVPSSPLTNVLIANDDLGSAEVSGFDYSLAAGTRYVWVNTAFLPMEFGPFSATITGPGQVQALSPVPEPDGLAMLLAGTGVVGLMARRLRGRRNVSG
ncbi:hypothetical protein GT347_25635 [Xylophilus rhododendri]|uniref:PEP-CTERM protein-sorting domain-containing protein n=1 Tax=Xylophilus rhododendri TaxID=2697032 RepID=A0A857JBL6_9BURK|nr:PEP-CTERM sorting domain-containing protein [Xylophilus rhododendri]QHJ01068.1 hypothetical protein GT347_25635 [Xylophilus rhododendri]